MLDVCWYHAFDMLIIRTTRTVLSFYLAISITSSQSLAIVVRLSLHRTIALGIARQDVAAIQF